MKAGISDGQVCAADRALASGGVLAFVDDDGRTLLAVPDVVLVQAHANGERTPHTLTVKRADGRVCAFFAVPPKGRNVA